MRWFCFCSRFTYRFDRKALIIEDDTLPRIGPWDLDIRPVTGGKYAYVMAYLEIQRRPIKWVMLDTVVAMLVDLAERGLRLAQSSFSSFCSSSSQNLSGCKITVRRSCISSTKTLVGLCSCFTAQYDMNDIWQLKTMCLKSHKETTNIDWRDCNAVYTIQRIHGF